MIPNFFRSHKHGFSEFFCAPETVRPLICVWFGRVTATAAAVAIVGQRILSCADLQGPAGLLPLCHSTVHSAVQRRQPRGKPDLQTSNSKIFRISRTVWTICELGSQWLNCFQIQTESVVLVGRKGGKWTIEGTTNSTKRR